jgi:hypothetical protein
MDARTARHDAMFHAPRRATALCVALFGLFACTGESGFPAGPSGRGLDSVFGTGEGDGDAVGAPDREPGRVTLHRLNRVEYNNTVRDLLGTTLRPADTFPPDDRGYGYDNIADVLSLSPLQLELYYNAAAQLVAEALKRTALQKQVFEAEAMTGSSGHALDGAWVLDSPGALQQTLSIEQAGEYRVSVRCWGEQAGDELAQLSLDINGNAQEPVDVPGDASSPFTYETKVKLAAGSLTIDLGFANDFYDGEAGLDRNLVIDSLSVEGPLDAQGGSGQRGKIMVCEPDPKAPSECLREVARSFGRRAFRRPLADDELDKLLALVDNALAAGDDLETATQTMLQAILVSPHFVFRVELDGGDGKPKVLSDYELAARLSYFLWSSMPDEELLSLAGQQKLKDDAVLRAQVRRMLKDEKAEALVENFAGQWLFTRALHDHDPDPTVYGTFDEALRESARLETEDFFRTFLFGEQSMDHMLSADFGFVDARLSEHYGVTRPAGEGFSEVTLPESRVGLLTQTTVLMVTSFPNRTSPVKRGKWVLEQLLCTPPPAPPKNIPPLEASVSTARTVREKLEEHRKNPVCASCHKLMDPLGFGLERYDGIGAFRSEENGAPVDDTGELIDGTKFQGPRELAHLIEGDPRYPRCIAQHVLTYALGRGLKAHDQADIDGLTAAFADSGYKLRSLIEQIVLSAPFRMRGVEAAGSAP